MNHDKKLHGESVPVSMATFGRALSRTLVVTALVAFQGFSHRAHEDQKSHAPDVQARAQREMFHTNREHHEIRPDEIMGDANQDAPEKDAV